MSTLDYLDPQGNVNFYVVGWTKLNEWLSSLNGNSHITGELPKGLNRGNVIRELEDRLDGNVGGGLRRLTNAVTRNDLGEGKDWRDYENAQGYTHLEELFIYQPLHWRKQAREYFFAYQYDLHRKSISKELRTYNVEVTGANGTNASICIFMSTSVLAVLFHPEMRRVGRYEPLNFLLSYGVVNPLPALFEELHLTKSNEDALLLDLSPLDYFFEFQKNVDAYDIEMLKKIGQKAKVSRLSLINELDFSKIVGQRLAKIMIRKELVTHFWSCCDETGGAPIKHPLSMIFAGPSGNGKTELAQELADLLNRPNDDTFLKIDCGQITDMNEFFGMSGAYQGAHEGSTLNNFVVNIGQEPNKIGVVLLDEIDKATTGIITGLYQVLDKGEWTNKQLTTGSNSQTSTISCRNIIFIMTVNAADRAIVEYAQRHPSVYTDGPRQMAEHKMALEKKIETCLQQTHPFTKAFIGRIGAFVPFLPMSAQTSATAEKLECEMMTVAKLLIERERDNVELGQDLLQIKQMLPPLIKHEMAKVVVQKATPEFGVRSIQKCVKKEMSQELMHACLLVSGGIARGSKIRYDVDKDGEKVSHRMIGLSDLKLDQDEEDDGFVVEDNDLFA
jgi:hypothetical protein